MATDDTTVTKTGLTLLQAEQRIEALEAAAAKALLILAETLKHKMDVDIQGAKLLSCVELLFTELKLEGVKHSQFVNESLERTAQAVEGLRDSFRENRRVN